MPTIEITCQFINYPKDGGKYGSIKTAEGHYYGARPAQLSMFQKGEVAQIEYSETTASNGKTYRNLVKKIAGALSGKQQQVIPQLRAATNPADSKQMFVTALLKEVITPTDSLDVLKARGDQYKRLYEHLFGTQEKQKNDQRMDDDIPEFASGLPDDVKYPEEGNWEREP